MRQLLWVSLLLVLTALSPAHAQRGAEAAPKPESYAGTWTGTWDGAGSGGGFDLTLEQPKDGPMIGKVAVTGEPAYKATLKSLAFEGKKMTGKYDFPADESAEVTLVATFEGNKATGTWSLAAKGAGAEVASGTWTVARK
jgi:hypothetical protein